MKVYSIYDIKSSSYGVPFFCVSDGVAVRDFSDAVRDKRTFLNKHPEDYALYGLADFDERSGVFSQQSNPIFLANGSEFVVPPKMPDELPFEKDEVLIY